VSNLSGLVVQGHGRIEAAKKLNMEFVPVIYQDFDDEVQEYSALVADNSIASWAELDLAMINAELPELGPDFDIDLLGLKDFELEPMDKYGDKDADAIPEPPKVAKSKLGDLWILGNHRLLCGDATNEAEVNRLQNGNKPLLMVTDPPYGVSYDAEWRKDALGDKFMGKVRTGKVSNDDNADWFPVWNISNAQVAYIWHASQFDHIVKESLLKADFIVRQQIIWNKTVAAMSRSAYHWKHEPCLYAVRKGCDANWIGDRKQNTVWDIASPLHIMSGSKEEKTDHPTQKPVEIYERPINHHLPEGGFMYDPFAGSGSCIVACEKTKRKCLAMELDPIYIDVILQRWTDYTGKDPVREDGVNWSELKKT
jgi:DNA modification methylase